MSSNNENELWLELEDAAQFDPSVRLPKRKFKKMLDSYIGPVPYTRSTLSEAMLAGEPYVASGFPNPLREPFAGLAGDELATAVVDWFIDYRSSSTHRVFTGPTGVRRDLTPREIALKWRENRTRFGITDLYIKNSKIEKEMIDPAVLNGFNLLHRSSVKARAEEQFSFVFSSRGHITDSHSDAPDSTNYCFVGKKLWLGWDTYEGRQNGLGDVERTPIARKARFDMETWADLKSARWLLVNPGETLFMPAHLTHKVITLEPYLGTGGFYISLPGCLRLLGFWVDKVPLWSKRDLCGGHDVVLDEIAQTLCETIQSAPRLSAQQRKDLGYDYLEKSAEHFIKNNSREYLNTVLSDPRFRRVADLVHAPWPDVQPLESIAA
ncbi:MAG: hypothetical protein ACR2OX_07115 [Methyloligellaceae bacterium]